MTTTNVRNHGPALTLALALAASLTVVAAFLVLGSGTALAAAPDVVGPGNGPFLCPSVGQGVTNHRPDAGQLPDGSYTFLPGHNQAGANANENALNTLPASQSPGPGNGNSDWSPIWPF
jgi:hypothetical protein